MRQENLTRSYGRIYRQHFQNDHASQYRMTVYGSIVQNEVKAETKF
jgi:hypothetical protein